jgi:hypothetical protein
MPRKRPGALRAQQPIQRPVAGEVPVRIHGLSSRASLAVHRVELLSNDYYLSPGATGKALRRYWAFLHPGGRRPLYPQDAACSCRSCALDDVRHARDVLEQALGLLPSREGAELRRVVQQLDDLYRRRTLPDPFAHRRTWHTEYWWHRRLAGS